MNRKTWILIALAGCAVAIYFVLPKWMWQGNPSFTKLSKLREFAPGDSRDNTEANPELVPPELIPFVNLKNKDEKIAQQALMEIASSWKDSYAVMLLELRGILENPRVRLHVMKLVFEKTNQQPPNLFGVYRWIWRPVISEHPRYADFKSLLYTGIDTRFRKVFAPRPETRVDLTELLFSGGHDDRVPSLSTPKMDTADKATKLRPLEAVIGIVVNGVAKAYPRSIVSHHEVVKDYVGDAEVLLTDCLCSGTVTAFSSKDEPMMEFFSSGFVYRSHKVLMDPKSSTLWSVVTGERIVGPKTKPLNRHAVVLTNWKSWRERHPNTWILAKVTGANKREGIDYSALSPRDQYLANDQIGSPVPNVAPLLPNKADVLVIAGKQPLGIALRYRMKNAVISLDDMVVLTNKVGASRVYTAGKNKFVSWDGKDGVKDDKGRVWKLTEEMLTGPGKSTCKRVVTYHCYWFAWNVMYPSAKLLK